VKVFDGPPPLSFCFVDALVAPLNAIDALSATAGGGSWVEDDTRASFVWAAPFVECTFDGS